MNMLNIFPRLCFAWLAAFSGHAFAAAQPFIPSPQTHVYISDDALVIRNTVLVEQLVNEAFSLLDAHPEIHRLWLIDVPGGIAIPGARLAWRAQEMDVIVAGGCYSACANVALSGRTLSFAPWRGKLPSAIIVHGAFTISGEWVTQSLNSRPCKTPRTRMNTGDAG